MLRVGALRAHRVLRLCKKQCGQVLVPSTAGFSWGAVFVPAGLAVRLQHSFTPALRKSLSSQQHKELTSLRSVPCQSCHTVLGQALSLPLHFCTPFGGVSAWCGTKSGALAVPCGVRAHPAGRGIPWGDQPLPGCLFVSAYLLAQPSWCHCPAPGGFLCHRVRGQAGR